mmetsp:Transcript_125591/g.355273  ORF Transcript_125591/g.355273 Transcript_125591/m.355273 type:complete len:204 (+) Transcript_125591:204-815(+)
MHPLSMRLPREPRPRRSVPSGQERIQQTAADTAGPPRGSRGGGRQVRRGMDHKDAGDVDGGRRVDAVGAVLQPFLPPAAGRRPAPRRLCHALPVPPDIGTPREGEPVPADETQARVPFRLSRQPGRKLAFHIAQRAQKRLQHGAHDKRGGPRQRHLSRSGQPDVLQLRRRHPPLPRRLCHRRRLPPPLPRGPGEGSGDGEPFG